MFGDNLQLQTQLEIDEGFEPSPYSDEFGNSTVFFGHNLTADPLEGMIYPGSRATGIKVLQADIQKAEVALWNALPWVANLSGARQGALINMTFNMGIDGLLTLDNFLQFMEEGDFTAAANDLKTNTLWYRQVGQRAVRLCDQITTNIWQYGAS